MIVKPKSPDLIVRDPKSMQPLPPEGKNVPETSYWIRRLNCGDVVLVEDSSETPVRKEKPKSTRKPSSKTEPATEDINTGNKGSE